MKNGISLLSLQRSAYYLFIRASGNRIELTQVHNKLKLHYPNTNKLAQNLSK